MSCVSSPLLYTAQHWAALECLLAHSLPPRRSSFLNAIGGRGTLKYVENGWDLGNLQWGDLAPNITLGEVFGAEAE